MATSFLFILREDKCISISVTPLSLLTGDVPKYSKGIIQALHVELRVNGKRGTFPIRSL